MSRAGSWFKSPPFWITIVTTVVVVISHQTSRKICTVVTWRRVGDLPCHSHQYSSAFLTSSRRGRVEFIPGRSPSFPPPPANAPPSSSSSPSSSLSQLWDSVEPYAGSNKTSSFSAERIFRRKLFAAAFWINWICANSFPFLLVPLHLQTLISSLIHVHLHNHTITHTKSLEVKNTFYTFTIQA